MKVWTDKLLLQNYDVFLSDKPDIVPVGPTCKVSAEILEKFYPPALVHHQHCAFDTIINHMDNGNTPFAVYLDLSKAFYTLNHSILLDKLKFDGFTERSINLIKH